MQEPNSFTNLQKQIDIATQNNQPIDDLVKQQIKLLQNAHDEFLIQAQKQGYDINSLRVGEIEIQQYSAMKQLAEKINLPTAEYDEAIKNVRIKVLGKEAEQYFFEN